MAPGARALPGLAVRPGGVRREVIRTLPEETAVAMVYHGSTQAVMMASPADLREFGTGFSLTEGIVETPGEIESLEVVAHDAGIEIQMWLAGDRNAALARRRRAMAGPVGCGLCGIDSLAEAVRPIPKVAGSTVFSAEDVDDAMAALRGHQPLHDQTRAVHAAGYWRPGDGIVLACEDVGRHNALDKLIGAMALRGLHGSEGAAVLTSRVSVEMVQKSAIGGFPVIFAVSAPTAHAVRLAEEAGMTLATMARGQGCEILAHPQRLKDGDCSHVA